MVGGRVSRLVVLAGVVLAAMVLLRQWPKDQTIHYVLGDSAPGVRELVVRWAEGSASQDWTREASFRYPTGQAPRVVTQTPRLADGDYTVEIEIAAAREPNVVRRHVTIGGGVTTIDLVADASPRPVAPRGEAP